MSSTERDCGELEDHGHAGGHYLLHDVHDLDAWTVASTRLTLSAHVVIDDSCVNDGHGPHLLDELPGCRVRHFDVEHFTFQLEPAARSTHQTGTH